MTANLDEYCIFCNRRRPPEVPFSPYIYSPLEAESYRSHAKACCTCGAEYSLNGCEACSHMYCNGCKDYGQVIYVSEHEKPFIWNKAETKSEEAFIRPILGIHLSSESSTTYLQHPRQHRDHLNKVKSAVYQLSFFGMIKKTWREDKQARRTKCRVFWRLTACHLPSRNISGQKIPPRTSKYLLQPANREENSETAESNVTDQKYCLSSLLEPSNTPEQSICSRPCECLGFGLQAISSEPSTIVH